MFGASIIVFRESLEAALLIGIIAAATRGLPSRNRWLAVGIGAGLLGSVIVALLTESIALLADGSGQELFNAAILGVAVLMLGWHNIWMASHGAEMAKNAKRVGQDIQNGTQELSTIAIVVALAVLREGAETALFLHGIASSPGTSGPAVVLGGALGLLLGAAAGVAIYAGLLRIPVRWFFVATSGLLLLVAAGLASQMARFLIQGDLLPALASPLWDVSGILPITSVLGSTLHILIGYDAKPSGMQVLFYVTTLVTIMLGTSWVRHQSSSHQKLKAI
jgi:high-affinity iron transporter